jgi:hypothetical protein
VFLYDRSSVLILAESDKLRMTEMLAWVNYMRDFFHENEIAKTAWVDFTARGIYAESFKVFIDTCVKDKAPPGAKA